jgi:hypothetical protein
VNASFGLDHPLLATNDIEGLRARLISLGFNMTAVGKHPWGTSTSLAMFDGCLLEIMGLYDETLVDEVPAGDFRFGRHIRDHLSQREGVALTALHSTNSRGDAEKAMAAGFSVAGHLEFGRDVTLPDGNRGRTKTTLALLPDATFPRLSLFLCQQHRPDLIYVPEWLLHPNKVTGIRGVNIVAEEIDHQALRARFGGLYGKSEAIEGGFQFQTANGMLRIMSRSAFGAQIGTLPPVLADETAPCIAGMDFTIEDRDVFKSFLRHSGFEFNEAEWGYALSNPQATANTTMRFVATR